VTVPLVQGFEGRRGLVVLAVLAFGWVALVLFAPWLPVPLAGVVYLFGGRICHQIAERSFFLDDVQLPVCARCLGIYVGAALGLVLSGRMNHGATAMLLALAINMLTVWSDSNPVRAAAGLVLGIALALAISTVDYERCRPLRGARSALPESRI
jgi:uncharacterized membrane protein